MSTKKNTTLRMVEACGTHALRMRMDTGINASSNSNKKQTSKNLLVRSLNSLLFLFRIAYLAQDNIFSRETGTFSPFSALAAPSLNASSVWETGRDVRCNGARLTALLSRRLIADSMLE